MNFHQVEVGDDGKIKFTGFQKQNDFSTDQYKSQNQITGKIYHFNEQLFDKIHQQRSGQKTVAGWLQLYLKKRDDDKSGKFWPFVFKNIKLKNHPRIKPDWEKFSYEDEEKDLKEDFDPDKLISLMKRNGEWDEEDDEIYGPETAKQMIQDEKNEEDQQESYDDGEPVQIDTTTKKGYRKQGELEVQQSEFQGYDSQDSNDNLNFDDDGIDPNLYQTKSRKQPQKQSFMDRIMSGEAPPDDDDKTNDKEHENDEFLFENYLKTGGYLSLKRKPQTEEEFDRQLLEDDELMFKIPMHANKRQKID
eukprot:403343555